MDHGNRYTLVVGGEELEVAASNGACLIYAREFRGKVHDPYCGSMLKDIVTDMATSESLGMVTWADVPQALGAVWAMARAAGSVSDGWEEFRRKVMDSDASMAEAVFAVTVMTVGDMAQKAFFRLPEGYGHLVEPDDEAEAEG